ncbi:hypothetical protein BPUTSESOX_432 [uncultured Gammaproteobacteria bacterium]|jgi:hypothetical protein|nr:hypothetical protein BPUTSESOX_432 [uncultured Gammaproteobacteria bacterium]
MLVSIFLLIQKLKNYLKRSKTRRKITDHKDFEKITNAWGLD